VSSPHGRTRDEMKAFFEKVKKLAPALVAIISPSASSTASAAPPLAAEDPCLRRLLARTLPCLLLPRSKMLRWCRLRFSVALDFSF
jgi:hypothetical protein